MKVIGIDHLARVEGNGGIHATIDGKIVSDVKFTINEGPRLIEKLVLGRTPEEDASMSPRICAICTCSHKNGVLRALENAMGVKISPKAYLLRELMHMGEFIESHALHTFYLALPDYLGFPNAIAMASEYEFEVKIALEMKHYGNHIMKVTNGRFIHGENAVIGGFGAWPTRDELFFIKSRAVQFMPFVFKTVDLFCGLDYPDVPVAETRYVCCEPGDGRYGFWGDEILISTGEKIPRDDYSKVTNEFVVSHSYAKHSRYQGQPFTVGALARIVNLGERLDGEAGEMYRKYYRDSWKSNPFYHNPSRALEILYAFERIPVLVDEFLKLEGPSSKEEYEVRDGKGTGLVEAPRGLLIHHHEVTDGKVSYADIITPTAQNADDIERYGLIAAQKLLDEGKSDDEIRRRLDILVRAYDPCISCSAHMAEIRNAPEDDWQLRLAEIQKQGSPVFVGVGNPELADDSTGAALASALRQRGMPDVWLESEIEDEDGLSETAQDRPLILLDAVNLEETPGKVILLPMNIVLQNSTLSHKMLPIFTEILTPEQMRNAWLLGIQVKSLDGCRPISSPVRAAMEMVLERLCNGHSGQA
jgi:sulfhydrogenase subunit alpha